MRMLTPLGEPYRIPRTQLALWGAREYVRRLWWAFVAIPITGILFLTLTDYYLLRIIGFMAIMWPLTIPGRSLLATRGASRRLSLPTRMLRDDEFVYFETEPTERSYRAALSGLRSATVRSDALVLEVAPLRFVFVPLSALGGAEAAREIARGLRSQPESAPVL